MEGFDPATEWLRLLEHYRQMSDTEIAILAGQSSQLTDTAQQILRSEISQRHLQVEFDEPVPAETEVRDRYPRGVRSEFSSPFAAADCSSAPDPSAAGAEDREDAASEADSADDPYAKDRALIDLRTVWSARDALKLQNLLDGAGIPFFMGPERATGADKVTSDFAKGVEVKIMSIGLPWARMAMSQYWPADEPEEEPIEIAEIPVRCPQCDSADVVFGRLLDSGKEPRGEITTKFDWTCEACGKQWEDDGVVEE
jgi:hypothetical protein